MYIVLGVIIQIVMCDAAMLRGRNDLPDMAASRDLSSTQDANKVVITNSCPSSLKLHLRYFEDKLRHVVFKDVRFNQKVQVGTNKKVTVALVAGEHDGKDLFLSKCDLGERGYIRYTDGRCYKFYYSSEFTVTCDGTEVTGGGNGIRGPTTDTGGPMC